MTPLQLTAAVLALTAGVVGGSCQQTVPASATSASSSRAVAPDALLPSPRLIVGRIIAVDPAQGLAFVDVAYDAPASALADGTELITRTRDLQETGRLRASRYVRGRTLGTKIIAGQPSPTDEVVWLAP